MKVSVTKNNKLVSECNLSDSVVQGKYAEFTIGRSSDSQIVLDDQMISRQQIKISFDGDKWFVENLNDSVNIFVGPIFLSGTIEIVEGTKIIVNDFQLNFYDIIKFENIPTPEPISTPTLTEIDQDLTGTSLQEKDNTGILEQEEEAYTEAEELGAPTQTMEETPSFEEENPLQDLDSSFDDSQLTDQNQIADEYNELNEHSEEGYEDQYDDYGGEVDNYDGGDSTRVLGGFAKFSLELFGEFAPYDTFNLEDKEIFIGRDAEKCKIVLQDPEVSAVHAVLRKNNITCTLEDLKSANGTILNGKRINSKELTNGDEFIIGSTTFTVNVGSEFIDSQKGMLMPVEENQFVEVEEIVEMNEDEFDEDASEMGEAPASTNKSLFSKDALKDPAKRKKLIYIIGGLMLAYVFLGDGESTTDSTAAKKKEPQKVEKVEEKAGEVKLTPEQVELVESLYQLGQAFLVEGKYPEAINEFDKLMAIKKDYKETVQLYQLAKEKLAQLEKAELERRAEEEKAIKRKKVQELLEKAEIAVKERNVTLSESLFVQIRELDPDNYDVTNLEIDLNAYKKEKLEKEMAEIQKKAERKRMVDLLAPGKALYLKEEWYRASGELEKFLAEKNMDEDLITEATAMLKESKEKLSEIVDPLLGKARSLKEGEDLKGSYAVYYQVLKYDPTSAEALNEMDDIKFILTSRAKKVYREAIVAESLGLFEKAKEKYQEIQQTTPDDNEYYRKASDRLKDL